MSFQRFVFALGLAILGLALVSATQPADDQPQKQPVDRMLEDAEDGNGGFMFAEHVTSKTGSGADLVITSARSPEGTPQTVRIRSGTMAIFRADAGRDDFTKRGGWYWRCGEIEGKARFKAKEEDISPWTPSRGAGALIRVVYQMDGTVHWYRLTYDFRC